MKGHTIVKKAFKIDLAQIEVGFLMSDKICYADNRNKAKSILLAEIVYEECKTKYTDKDVTYLNIPVLRAKNLDVVMFRGEETKRYLIDGIIAKEVRDKRLNDMLKENPGAKAYVKNGNYGSYWGPNHSGYADSVIFAGVYSIDEAVRIVLSSSLDRQESVIIIDTEERNHEIDHKISKLNTEIERLKGQRI